MAWEAERIAKLSGASVETALLMTATVIAERRNQCCIDSTNYFSEESDGIASPRDGGRHGIITIYSRRASRAHRNAMLGQQCATHLERCRGGDESWLYI